MGGVTLLRVTPDVSWTQPLYIYIYIIEVFDFFIERRGKDVEVLLNFLVTIIYQHMKGCINP